MLYTQHLTPVSRQTQDYERVQWSSLVSVLVTATQLYGWLHVVHAYR